jgi:hypothetical protein
MYGTYGTTGPGYGKGIPPTAQEVALSNFMVNSRATFARNPIRGPG